MRCPCQKAQIAVTSRNATGRDPRSSLSVDYAPISLSCVDLVVHSFQVSWRTQAVIESCANSKRSSDETESRNGKAKREEKDRMILRQCARVQRNAR